MIAAIRGYTDAPINTANVAVLTQSETITKTPGIGGATGSEFANSRLGNFLSDDPAPRDRDLDTLMSSVPLGLYDKGPESATREETPSRAEVAPAPPPEDLEPIARAPLEDLLNSQMRQQDDNRQEMMFKGISSGSVAQQMYTNTQDVLSRIAA